MGPKQAILTVAFADAPFTRQPNCWLDPMAGSHPWAQTGRGWASAGRRTDTESASVNLRMVASVEADLAQLLLPRDRKRQDVRSLTDLTLSGSIRLTRVRRRVCTRDRLQAQVTPQAASGGSSSGPAGVMRRGGKIASGPGCSPISSCG